MEKEKVFLYKVLAVFVIVLTFAVVYFSLFAGGVAERYASSLNPARTVAVSASGKSFVKPDIAVLSFSVVTEGNDISKITDENNAKINKAIDLLKSQNIDPKDIQTSEYNLSPVYSQPVPLSSSAYSFVPKISGYTLTQSVSVKVRDFSKISPVMGELPGLGINRISGVSFQIEDQEKYLSEARKEAFDNARKKAENIASENNFTLGNIINVSEYANQPYYYEKALSSGIGGVVSPSAAPQIEPGSKEITLNVSVVYEIR